MLTYSGKRVSVENEEAPTIKDIAINLGKAPRFGGSCKKWWTVLHHSIAAAMLARDYYVDVPMSEKEYNASIVYALFHDAHEAITGDVPKDWKPEIMTYMQDDLDKRIYSKIGIPFPDVVARERIKLIDAALLVTEAKLVGPPRVSLDEKERLRWDFPAIESYLQRRDQVPLAPMATSVINAVSRLYATPLSTVVYDDHTGEAVGQFMIIARQVIKNYRRAND